MTELKKSGYRVPEYMNDGNDPSGDGRRAEFVYHTGGRRNGWEAAEYAF